MNVKPLPIGCIKNLLQSLGELRRKSLQPRGVNKADTDQIADVDIIDGPIRDKFHLD